MTAMTAMTATDQGEDYDECDEHEDILFASFFSSAKRRMYIGV